MSSRGSLYLGKAGQMYVMAEFLERGWNPAPFLRTSQFPRYCSSLCHSSSSRDGWSSSSSGTQMPFSMS